jgi:glutamate carboxypeptidase
VKVLRGQTPVTKLTRKYLGRALRNACIDVLKRRALDVSRLEHLAREITASVTPDVDGTSERWEWLLGRLHGRPREVVLAFAAGMDRREVAAMLGISVRTVDAHLRRAKGIAREELERERERESPVLRASEVDAMNSGTHSEMPAMRSFVRALTVGTLVCLVAAPSSAQLSQQEQRIAQNVEANRAETIALLERTVNINSGTLNPAGVRRVYDALAPHFEALGFQVRYVEQPAAMNRGGHLVATRAGNQGRKLLLIGHLDTVFEEDSPFQRWESVNDSIARGPGVNDMKGGNVVMWSALQALHAAGALDGADITVVMTGDEEAPGSPLDEARRALYEAGDHADIALGFEGGTPGLAVIARRSASAWQIEIEATTAHSSGVFRDDVGAGAIYEAARILEDFYSEIRGEEYLTFNAATIVGGTEAGWDRAASRGTAFGKTNVVPPLTVITGDIRTISDEQRERAREKMRQIVARSLPGTSSRITFYDGYPAMPPTAANRELLGVLDRVSHDLGEGEIEPFDPGRRGAADISFVASRIEAGLDGLGPSGDGSHTALETVNLRSIERAAKRAAVLIFRLTRPQPPL